MANTQVPSELIATNAISGTIIADNAITSVHIAQNQVTAVQIPDGSITATQIAADAVGATELAASSVVTASIQDDQVTGDKLTNNITVAGTLAAGSTITSGSHVIIPATSRLYLDGSGNTFIEETAADTVTITTNNSERLRIDASGDVGIGTQSPSSYNSNTRNLVIRDSGSGGITISTGASNTGYVAFNDGEDTTIEGLIAYNQSNDVMSFRTASTDDRLTIDGSGNVNIPADSVKLQLGAGNDLQLYHDGSNSYIANEYGVLYIDQRVQDGNMIFRNDDGSGGNAEYFVLDGGGEEIKMKKKTWFEGSTDLYVDLFADSGTSQGSGSFRFYTDGGSAKESVAGIVMQQEDGTSRKGEMLFQVADNGNPATALKIFNNKDVQVDGRIASYYSGSSHVAIRGLNGGQYIQYSSSLDLKFMRIDTYPNSGANHTMSLSGAKVKIGSDSPPLAGILSVVGGNAGVPALFVQNTNVDSVGLRAQVANNNAGNYIIAAYNSDGAKWNIRNDGDHQGTDTSIGSLSDSRLKKDVSDLTYDINKFKQYRPIEFNWINPELHKSVSGKSRGFLAQEVKALDDYYVDKYEAEGDDIPLVDEDKMAHSTKFGYKDAMYISVIKQLITRLETAEAKIAVLEG